MNDLRKAARYAKEVLDYVDRFLNMNETIRYGLVRDAIADLDKALAQPEPLSLSDEAKRFALMQGGGGAGGRGWFDGLGSGATEAKLKDKNL